jgi:hypothetical protein
MRLLSFLLLTSITGSVFAQAPYTRDAYQSVLSGVALNAAAASRTIEVQARRRYAKIRVLVDYTDNASTDVTATPSCALDSTYGSYTSRSVATGTSTVSPLVDYLCNDAAETCADFTKVIEYDVAGCNLFKIVFAGTSGGASDLISVEYALIVGN